MSLLEDVFLEDEAGEARDLERVIEGDEFDDRPRTPNSDENSEKEDEAEEDKRRVDHTEKAKRAVKNPRFVLNPARLTGPRGIQIIPEHFKDFKFKGKGHEREDLDVILKKLEHWAYRLYPKFKFDDCLKKIEALGKKRPVMVHLHKIRTDQFMSEETVVQRDSSDDEAEAPAPAPEEDEFDRLLQQQIEKARSTPAPGSVRKELLTPVANRSVLAPKATSSPSISDEQKERMIRNRKLAEEKRLARLKNLHDTAVVNGNISKELSWHETETSNLDRTDNLGDSNVNDKDDMHVVRKLNRSNVIDSSDEESDVMTVNASITVDIHNKVNEETNSETGNVVEERAMEPEKLVETSDEIIDDNVLNVNDNIVIGELPSNNQVAPENKDDTEINSEIQIEHETYVTDETKNVSDDDEKKIDDSANTEEQTGSQMNKPEREKVTVSEDLMDVDFSDDF